jgi:hypothetical protein
MLDVTRDIGPVERFGFPWRAPLSLRKPLLTGVGFIWISLDSLVRIEPFQWVTGDNRRKFFRAPLPWRKRSLGSHGPDLWRDRIVHRRKLKLISDLLQAISAFRALGMALLKASWPGLSRLSTRTLSCQDKHLIRDIILLITEIISVGGVDGRHQAGPDDPG